jgi:hypothetical protein
MPLNWKDRLIVKAFGRERKFSSALWPDINDWCVLHCRVRSQQFVRGLEVWLDVVLSTEQSRLEGSDERVVTDLQKNRGTAGLLHDCR